MRTNFFHLFSFHDNVTNDQFSINREREKNKFMFNYVSMTYRLFTDDLFCKSKQCTRWILRVSYISDQHLSRCSTCVLVYFSWLLDYVIYLKLSRELLICKAEQIHKVTLQIVLDEQSCDFVNLTILQNIYSLISLK